MSVHEQCFILGGYSQPPRDTAVMFAFHTLYCQLLINKSSHCVVDCHLNLPSPLARDYLAEIIRGHCMDDDLEPLIARIRANAHLLITNSVIHALRNALERYREIIQTL